MTAVMISPEAFHNPVDVAELALMDRDVPFDRLDDGQLLAEVKGMWGTYRVWLNWQEENSGLTIGSSLEVKMPTGSLSRIHELFALVNEKLWLGHFEFSSEDHTISFRHTQLIRTSIGTDQQQLQDLIDIAVQECDRFYPAFQAVAWGGKSPIDALQFALFETIAEA